MTTPKTTPKQPVTDYAPRCKGCGRMLAIQVTRPWRISCSNHRCKTLNEGA